MVTKKKILLSDKYSALDPAFLSEAFQAAIKYRKLNSPHDQNILVSAALEEYGDLSRRVDKSDLQDSVGVRNVLRTRLIATLLVDDHGEILTDLIPDLIEGVKKSLYSLGPSRQHDSARQEQILSVLCYLRDSKEYLQLLKRISKPYSHKIADQVIRETLQLLHNAAVTDAHARRAVLSAWMCYLRQNVGSCFGTAPSIIIHDAQPHAFLSDLDEMLTTGRIKRTFGGIEYTAPISTSWGAGDLRRPCLVPRSEKYGATNLWVSPGLLEALTAAGILDASEAMKDRAARLKEILAELFEKWEGRAPYFYVCAEDIISALLMEHLNITREDLVEYSNRPREMIQGALMVQVPKSAISSGGKGEHCARYQVLFDSACVAFKQLADNALLKSWEFTVASFAETKATFSKWNFYSSLGLNHDDVDGLGPCIYKAVERQLEELNSQVRMHQERYEVIYGQVKHLETRIRHVSSESEGQWLRAELQSMVNEFKSVQEMRDTAQMKAQNMASLYSVLVEIYEAIFPRYFQEVYDAEIHEVDTGPYDDSPAGFRLVYKYGRANSSQWVPIRTAGEFIEALVSFFVATETEITSSPHFEGMKDIISNIVSTLVLHVRTKEFLESALRRMAFIHRSRLPENPLDNLDKVEKKPWVYTSGGNMEALVSCYFGLLKPPTTVTRWIESPIELLVFLIDIAKQMTAKETAALARSRRPALLMHSPTHAFLFMPTLKKFQELTAAEAFTYTWTRDSVVIPLQRFVANIVLDEAKMSYLTYLLAEKVPLNYRPRFKEVFDRMYGTMNPAEFRQEILDVMQREIGLQTMGTTVISAEEIDSLLYSQIPLITLPQVGGHVEEILNELPGFSLEERQEMMGLLEHYLKPYQDWSVVGAKGLQDIVKGLICLAAKSPSTSFDYHKLVACAAQKLGFAMPAPILIGDTNWIKDYFGFTVNPGNGAFELWRLDVTGSEGFPMSAWKQWLDGSRREPPWGVYIHPHEYQK